MMGIRACLGAVIVASGALISSVAVAGPSMSVGWMDVNSDQDACVRRASNAIKHNGFTVNFEVVSNRTIFGERGDYTATIRCAAERQVAFIAVAGPYGQSSVADKYLGLIRDSF